MKRFNPGCCERCQIEPPKPAYHGDLVNDAKQAAYEESRRRHAEAVGRPAGRMRIRGSDD